jgi:sporulation protein YlmC with PRC-barrel domain
LLDLKKRLVVTRDEGVRVGVTSGLIVDEAVGRISALILRKKWRSGERWVRTSDVVSVGPDLVVISTTDKIHEGAYVGRRLADYRGCWVTSISGSHLGRLADVGTAGDDWGIHRLEFQDGSTLEMDGTEMVFGRDEILIPDRFEDRVIADASAGVVSRWLRAGRGIFGANGKDAAREDGRSPAAGGEEASVDVEGPIFGPEPPNEGDHDEGRRSP